MKCPKCWSPKTQASDAGWPRRLISACFLLVPMRCRHCFHTYHATLFHFGYDRASRPKSTLKAETALVRDPEVPHLLPFPGPDTEQIHVLINLPETKRRRAA